MDRFLKEAIKEAKRGLEEGGIPIGSVLVKDGKIIGRGRNRRVQKDSAVLHAEIDCLQNAGRIRDYSKTTLYSTLMPCYLCAGAVVQFGIKRVVVGENLNYGGAETERFLKAHGVEVVNLQSEECAERMREFIEKNPELWKEDSGQ
jgi:creatinine deaminase